MVMSSLLSISSCYSISPSHTGDRWTKLNGACATMVFPIIYDMKLLFSPYGNEPKRLSAPLSAIAECGLWYTHLFL